MLIPIMASQITIHSRVALTLLAAEYASSLLKNYHDTYVLLNDVINAGWSWIADHNPDPETMYWTYNPKLMEDELNYHNDEHLLAAFHCCLYMHYYTIWKADAIARYEQPETIFSVGNEIAEVDESYLMECLELAVKVSSQPEKTIQWLNDLINKIMCEYKVKSGEVIGGKIERRWFVVSPEI